MIKSISSQLLKSKFSTPSQGRTRENGLTLVEIMLVIIIIGLVSAMVGRKLFGAGDKMRANLCDTQLKQIQAYIEQFQLRYNQLPTNLNDLYECTSATGQGCVPFANKDELLDPWGSEFRYSKNGNRYKISSLGADGQEGGDGVNYDRFVEGP
ncbi:MAG: type II secretion system protein GspG [Bdellovibrionales bacterium]|nr:type II secretion system protein GspG [Bdellovibrionales bacterium]